MKSQETMLRRREAEFKMGQESLARELSQTLVLLPYAMVLGLARAGTEPIRPFLPS